MAVVKELLIALAVDAASGLEGLCIASSPSAELPLLTTDPEDLARMSRAARQMADLKGVTIRIVRFVVDGEVAVLVPGGGN